MSEQTFDNRPPGSKEWAFLGIYRRLAYLQQSATDLSNAIRNVVIDREGEAIRDANYVEIVRATSPSRRAIRSLLETGEKLKEPEKSSFTRDIDLMRDAIREVVRSCHHRDSDGLRNSLEDLDDGCEILELGIELYSIAAYGAWGSYLFWMASEELYEEDFDNEVTTAGLTELLRTTQTMLRDTFILTPLQKRILAALDGTSLKKESLAEIVCKGQGRMLYKPGGIRELRAQGLVGHMHGVGYYRPDAPPS